jgi:hypothetical protein
MVKIYQTGLLKSNFETRPKKRIFRFLPKISAGHGWSLKFFFANFQILGPLGCQGWVVIPQNVKKSQNHCTLPHKQANFMFLLPDTNPILRLDFLMQFYDNSNKKIIRKATIEFAWVLLILSTSSRWKSSDVKVGFLFMIIRLSECKVLDCFVPKTTHIELFYFTNTSVLPPPRGSVFP